MQHLTKKLRVQKLTKKHLKKNFFNFYNMVVNKYFEFIILTNIYKYIPRNNNKRMTNNSLIDAAILVNVKTLNKKNLVEVSNKIAVLLCIDYEVVFNRVQNIYIYRSKLKELQKIPFVKQRSPEWFDMRKQRLTASDLYDAIKGGNTSLNLAKKKANIIVDTINYNSIPALKWGTMFEPMASRCYSQAYNNIEIYDFGLICDPTNEHFGASPDGINDLGIMIEIKCPFTRKIIDDNIPVKYQLQIQGQLAVCGLNECDYVECEFKTFTDEYEYLSNVQNDLRINHGVIAEYIDNEKQYYYLYSTCNITPSDALININDEVSKNPINNLEFIKFHYWVLKKINTQKVYFDEQEWANIVPKIDTFWNKVEECRLMPQEVKIAKKIQFINDPD